ncbi:MAG: phosphoribosylamine--glycine ligase [Candidatus Adiutrix sp.]
MKILVVGGGAREHALVWKLAQSPKAQKIYAAPGNPGFQGLADCVPIKADDILALTKWAQQEKPDLTVIGPEIPLALGLADKLSDLGFSVFGPKAFAAQLESSKQFSKDFMRRHNIPTADYHCFSTLMDALAHIEAKNEGPIVVKASGLAQGKGVMVANNRKEAANFVRLIMEEKCFGAAGGQVVIEDFISGEEVSLLTFTDGQTMVPMVSVQDHKRVGEGDCGPNTGGMGAYAPVSVYTQAAASAVKKTIIDRILQGFKADNMAFCGCLYIGLMLPDKNCAYEGPQVIEFNARFGDPETEVLMPLLKTDLLEIMLACVKGTLAETPIVWREEHSACVVVASGGYPGDYETGFPIEGAFDELKSTDKAIVFQAGTCLSPNGTLLSCGGRVLTACALGPDLEAALALAYQRISRIKFKGAYFRRDIGHHELARQKWLT